MTAPSRVSVGLLIVFTIFHSWTRFFPFPSGVSQDDLKGLSENLAGIVFALLFYVASTLLALGSLKWKRTEKPPIAIVLLLIYAAVVLVQAPFRPDPWIELIRSLAQALCILSAIAVGWLLATLSSDPRAPSASQLFVGLGSIAVFLGLLTAAILPRSVYWGPAAPWISPILTYSGRAEFFFLHINPSYWVLAAAALALTGRKPTEPRRFLAMLGLMSTLALLGLSLLTRTRSYLFPIVIGVALAAVAWLFQRLGRGRLMALGLVVVAITAAAVVRPGISDRTLEFFRLKNASSLDWSNSRNELNQTLISYWKDRPIVGYGANAMRAMIYSSPTRAKTEHGFTAHLASYGFLALPFFCFVILTWWNSARAVAKMLGRIENEDLWMSAVSGALGLMLGFAGSLGSSTGASDWLTLTVACMFSFLSVRTGWNR